MGTRTVRTEEESKALLRALERSAPVQASRDDAREPATASDEPVTPSEDQFGGFLVNIVNTLRAPVGNVMLLADSLAAEPDPAVVARLSGRLQQETQIISDTVDDLALLSRVDSADEIAQEEIPLHSIVVEASERVRSAAHAKEITINFGEPLQRLTILGDRRQLVSALYNLLDNAVKYSASETAVEVRGRPVGDFVELSVKDEGIGIAETDIEQVCKHFYRAEGARMAHAGGVGLGLTVVDHVARNHHGILAVESREGEGSTFVLKLPAGPRVASTAKAG